MLANISQLPPGDYLATIRDVRIVVTDNKTKGRQVLALMTARTANGHELTFKLTPYELITEISKEGESGNNG